MIFLRRSVCDSCYFLLTFCPFPPSASCLSGHPKERCDFRNKLVTYCGVAPDSGMRCLALQGSYLQGSCAAMPRRKG